MCVHCVDCFGGDRPLSLVDCRLYFVLGSMLYLCVFELVNMDGSLNDKKSRIIRSLCYFFGRTSARGLLEQSRLYTFIRHVYLCMHDVILSKG